ncbi:glycoside hydrolase family 16 protein [Mycolicibacterium vanbaalenii]|uniref:glycoside hydrolase family 16 protein n=1 Tax=Mycolicibacterium vanbaalenii TaxID=110539 RepID=UPI001F47497D|nr:glycoside hydrolase family 16 protein [Mycolicibacterium vanbaalenii]
MVGKSWLAGGLMAAGLGAAVVAGAATAAASPADPGTTGSPSTSDSDAGDSRTARVTDSSTASDGAKADSRRDREDKRAAVRDATSDDDSEAEAEAEVVADGETEDATDEPDTEVVEIEVVDTDEAASDDAGVTTDADDVAEPALVRKGADTDDHADDDAEDRDAVAGDEPMSKIVAATSASTAPEALTATAVETDPALIAAATSTKVTFRSMMRDWLYSIGIRHSKLGIDDGGTQVPTFIANWWRGVRARIYRDVVIPAPTEPTEPTEPSEPTKPTLWETNFTDMAEALRYWGLQTGRWGQPAGENQYYTDGDNVYVDADGNLVIEARREAAPDGLGAPNNYTSARVVTFGKQSIGVGTRVVARIQMPVTQGVLPAFWSVGLEPGHEYDWPRQGEIDIVEIPGLGTPASRRWWTGNIHGPADANNTVDVKLHHLGADLGVDLSQDFHEYGMDWYSDRIVWHVDGVEVGRVTQAQYEALGGDWTPFSGAWDHYLILNVAVGNPWTGDPDPSAPFQAQMKVDWVKTYALS